MASPKKKKASRRNKAYRKAREVEKKKRSLAAKKAWATRKKKARARSAAAKKGWEKRKSSKPSKPAKVLKGSMTPKPPRPKPSKVLKEAMGGAPEGGISSKPKVEKPLGFAKGPDWIRARKELRHDLGHEPTAEQVERRVERERAERKKNELTFDEVMDRVRKRGLRDDQLFRKIAARFNVSVHTVYQKFFSPKVGGKKAA